MMPQGNLRHLVFSSYLCARNHKKHTDMGKTEKPTFLDYLNAVKKADREREIAQHGKQISTRPLRIVKSKKVYDRNRKKRDCSGYDDNLFFLLGAVKF